MCVVKEITRRLAVGTPVIACESHDHPHTIERLVAELEENPKDRPLINWNLADGMTALNELGKAAIETIDAKELKAAQSAGLHAVLHVSRKLPGDTVLVVENLHWGWEKPAVMQTILNLREPFKATNRCLIGLILNSAVPSDLLQTVDYVEDPLPTQALLQEKVRGIFSAAYGDEKNLETEEAEQIAQELRGCSPFRAEQLTALSLTKTGVDRSRLRDNAKKQINDTVGLATETTTETFEDIGGLDAICDFLKRYFNGPRKPSVVVRIEEIEKAFAGVGTESSGTSGDALGELLTSMEDFKWNGLFAYGVSGCGKSLIAKAAANEFGVKALRLDIGACKGSLVGQSEQQIRKAMEVLHAIGGDRVFFVASMNQISSLPPELRRRFAAGTWYFDVPSAAGRADIWDISAKQFNVEYDGYDAEDLTGADIRDIVQRSHELSCSTTEAAGFHVPLCKAAPDAISQSRSDAQGRYLDANFGGPYREQVVAKTKKAKRAIDLS